MDPARQNAHATLADILMNKALACDRAGHQSLATAHLEVAMQVMLTMAAADTLVIRGDDLPPDHVNCRCDE